MLQQYERNSIKVAYSIFQIFIMSYFIFSRMNALVFVNIDY